MNKDKVQILKVLVGSQAHGLADEDSDHDYRGVYVNATEDILRLGHKYKGNHWVEGESEDQTYYEINHFLCLATKCNPTILEVFKAPNMATKDITEGRTITFTNEASLGIELQKLFPYIWCPKKSYEAFVGYSSNQRKKMLDKKDDRGPKFACAYLRTLLQLHDLLEFGTFDLKVKDGCYKDYLLEIKNGHYKPGEIIDIAEQLIEECKVLRDKSTQEQDLDKVHEFLIKIRKQYWELPDVPR